MPVPFGTVPGLKEQEGGFAAAGVMLRVNTTAPVKAFSGVIVIVEVAHAPAATVAGATAVGGTVKSGISTAVTVIVTMV